MRSHVLLNVLTIRMVSRRPEHLHTALAKNNRHFPFQVVLYILIASRNTRIEVRVENNSPEILITRSITFLLPWGCLRGESYILNKDEDCGIVFRFATTVCSCSGGGHKCTWDCFDLNYVSIRDLLYIMTDWSHSILSDQAMCTFFSQVVCTIWDIMANKHKHVSQIVSINLGRTPIGVRRTPIGDSYVLSPEANMGKTLIGGVPNRMTPLEWGTSYLDRGMAYQSCQCVHMANY